jgi:uncharacterized membrane protein YphA (DoxX/SURF4 family)
MFSDENVNYQGILLLVFRLYLGVIFLSSAIGKLRNYDSFIEELAAYRLIPSQCILLSGMLIILVEALVGVAMFSGVLVEVGLLVSVLMLFVFTSAVGIKVIRKSRIKCGCFGIMGGDRELGWDTVVRNVYLIIIAAAALAIDITSVGDERYFGLFYDVYVLISFVFVLVSIFLFGYFIDLYTRMILKGYEASRGSDFDK